MVQDLLNLKEYSCVFAAILVCGLAEVVMMCLVAVANQTIYPALAEEGMVTQFFIWVLLGLIAGFIASKLVNKKGEGFILDILLGVAGAFIGGWLFRLFGSSGVTGLNLWSLLVAVVGAVVFLIVYHGFRGLVHH
jgi:uncharacterized membrane protein YeaQ/YmgE (transglycosylase-associated protein family)